MTLRYSLSEDDYLTHQLYIASKTERIKKQRRRSWLILTFCSLVLSFLFSENDNKVMMYYFLALGIIILIFYPFYQRRYYRNHYQKYIKENYKNKINEITNLIFGDTFVESFDRTGEGKMYLSEFEKLIEIKEYFFIGLKTGGSLIIPKLKLENIEETKLFLKNLAEKLQIEYSSALDWKWK